ncbi:uncharacterized protein LOC119725741 [Patiria miniata]|uniref:Ig-like domain-containing protein n=1 Tax=Patiria miniata TaxID=46514 RepID=A0A913ZNA9_PATMI|nr:uncharacterized protein LOC119725741 [Patiria miniata]
MAKLLDILLLLVLTGLMCSAVAMEFAMQPGNITGYEGDTVILTCVVSDKDEDQPVYWQRYDGSRLGPISRDRDTAAYAHHFPDLSPRLEIVGDESRGEYHLLISDLSLEDQGRFVCTFYNEDGYGVYAPITYVSVLPRTRVSVREGIDPVCQATVSTPLQAVSIGTTVELVCDAHGRPDITSLTWYVGAGRGSSPVGSCSLSKGLPQRICTFRRTLTLQDVGVNFKCIARVGPSEEQGHEGRPGLAPEPNCSLQPLTKKTIVDIQPPSKRVTAGETATFFCAAGTPPSRSPFRYTWYLNNGQQLTSATSTLMISSTSGYMHDNHVTCVVSDHFGYFGHGTAVLIVEMSRDDQTTRSTHIDTTNNIETTIDDMNTKLTESIPPDTTFSPNNDSSIDILKPLSHPDTRSTSVFPLMLVISLAAGTVLMAVLLAVVTACVIKQRKRDRCSLNDKAIQLEAVRPAQDLRNDNSKSGKNSKRFVPRAPSVNKQPPAPEPVASLCINNKQLTTYAVLDPDQVDNDSLNSLDLQEIIQKSEGSSQGTGDSTVNHPKESPKNRPPTTSSGGRSKLPRGRSASTPHGPVIVYAGDKKTQDFSAVAYAVTNIVEDRPAVAKNTGKTPTSSYDNNRISGYAVSAKVISRKRAMSSPMTSGHLTNGEEATTKSSTISNMKAPFSDSARARLLMDDTCAYAEISEICQNAGDASQTDQTESNGGAVCTVPEPPFPRSYLRGDNDSAYAVSKVVSSVAKD